MVTARGRAVFVPVGEATRPSGAGETIPQRPLNGSGTSSRAARASPGAPRRRASSAISRGVGGAARAPAIEPERSRRFAARQVGASDCLFSLSTWTARPRGTSAPRARRRAADVEWRTRGEARSGLRAVSTTSCDPGRHPPGATGESAERETIPVAARWTIGSSVWRGSRAIPCEVARVATGVRRRVARLTKGGLRPPGQGPPRVESTRGVSPVGDHLVDDLILGAADPPAGQGPLTATS